jgi:hypothetical protein
VHNSFADYGALADQVGLDLGATTTGLRSIAITRRLPGSISSTPCRRRRATSIG